jgi:hypothetical protein
LSPWRAEGTVHWVKRHCLRASWFAWVITCPILDVEDRRATPLITRELPARAGATTTSTDLPVVSSRANGVRQKPLEGALLCLSFDSNLSHAATVCPLARALRLNLSINLYESVGAFPIDYIIAFPGRLTCLDLDGRRSTNVSSISSLVRSSHTLCRKNEELHICAYMCLYVSI